MEVLHLPLSIHYWPLLERGHWSNSIWPLKFFSPRKMTERGPGQNPVGHPPKSGRMEDPSNEPLKEACVLSDSLLSPHALEWESKKGGNVWIVSGVLFCDRCSIRRQWILSPGWDSAVHASLSHRTPLEGKQKLQIFFTGNLKKAIMGQTLSWG